ncbi:hypothetical protein K488DRAFT_68926 [Vararia minispora EC-137]|uniref:Uncharacterized protein n=1 Tax=Vararia minispora EC-137 TaxID=1314806 RepID=A0ACB8QTJ8_9AGAM|nr:hypothetical protein K488DRAFT_68926 [Vararia minispora EC-137]
MSYSSPYYPPSHGRSDQHSYGPANVQGQGYGYQVGGDTHAGRYRQETGTLENYQDPGYDYSSDYAPLLDPPPSSHRQARAPNAHASVRQYEQSVSYPAQHPPPAGYHTLASNYAPPPSHHARHGYLPPDSAPPYHPPGEAGSSSHYSSGAQQHYPPGQYATPRTSHSSQYQLASDSSNPHYRSTPHVSSDAQYQPTPQASTPHYQAVPPPLPYQAASHSTTQYQSTAYQYPPPPEAPQRSHIPSGVKRPERGLPTDTTRHISSSSLLTHAASDHPVAVTENANCAFTRLLLVHFSCLQASSSPMPVPILRKRYPGKV